MEFLVKVQIPGKKGNCFFVEADSPELAVEILREKRRNHYPEADSHQIWVDPPMVSLTYGQVILNCGTDGEDAQRFLDLTTWQQLAIEIGLDPTVHVQTCHANSFKDLGFAVSHELWADCIKANSESIHAGWNA